MPQVERDAPAVGAPVQPVQAELGARQPLPDGAGVRAAQDGQGGRAQENQPPARPQEARRLYAQDPAVLRGRLAVRVMTWMVPAGNVAFAPVNVPSSVAEAMAD